MGQRQHAVPQVLHCPGPSISSVVAESAAASNPRKFYLGRSGPSPVGSSSEASSIVDVGSLLLSHLL